nr:hypothetical protein [Desulfobulbaceae bacterium]
MKTTVGLWIDHRKAVIVAISDKEEEIKVIESKVEKQLGRSSGKRSTTSFEAQMVPADNSQDKKFTAQLNTYYEEVISVIHNAESLLIFGPGEAKGELVKQLEKDKLAERIVSVETADQMTDPQITAKVREYFQQ